MLVMMGASIVCSAAVGAEEDEEPAMCVWMACSAFV